MKRPMYKKGGKMKKKKSFPDMSGDGKVNKKEILIKQSYYLNKRYI